MNNSTKKRVNDDDLDPDDDFVEVTVNEDDIPENKDIFREVDETERQQWDEDDSTLPDGEVGMTRTGMADVDSPNRNRGMHQGAPDEGSIVGDEDVEVEDISDDEEDDDDDLVDVPM